MQKRYYVDSCIWLNLFKKEGDETKGKPYWKIAEEFIEYVMSSEDEEIVYTMPVLREIKLKLPDWQIYSEKEAYIIKEFCFVEVTDEDILFARKLEAESNYTISFFDCMHTAVCKRIGTILVTRDKKLLVFANKYILALKPEYLFEAVKPFNIPFFF